MALNRNRIRIEIGIESNRIGIESNQNRTGSESNRIESESESESEANRIESESASGRIASKSNRIKTESESNLIGIESETESESNRIGIGIGKENGTELNPIGTNQIASDSESDSAPHRIVSNSNRNCIESESIPIKPNRIDILLRNLPP